MKKFKINIKYCKNAEITVIAKNKKEAKRMLQDVIKNSNLIDLIKPKEEDYLYKILEDIPNEE